MKLLNVMKYKLGSRNFVCLFVFSFKFPMVQIVRIAPLGCRKLYEHQEMRGLQDSMKNAFLKVGAKGAICCRHVCCISHKQNKSREQ